MSTAGSLVLQAIGPGRASYIRAVLPRARVSPYFTRTVSKAVLELPSTMTSTSQAPKAIIFDLLTGLLNSWTAWDRAVETATNSSSSTGNSGKGFEWRKHYLALTFGVGAYRPYGTLVHESAALAGLPASAADALLENWDAWITPWPETPATLASLRAKGYKLGVVTNCSVELGRRAAALCGLEFDAVVTAEESGWYKPVPEAYTAILGELNVDVKDVLFVAGSAGDVSGAKGAGMRVVWHNHIGLPAIGNVVPEKEGKTLYDALEDVPSRVSIPDYPANEHLFHD